VFRINLIFLGSISIFLSHPCLEENMAKFIYLGTTVTNQNLICEETKTWLNPGNISCHSVQNLLLSHLFFKTPKINIYRRIILPVLYGYETLSLTLREVCRRWTFEYRVHPRGKKWQKEVT
jgi:hypothetical protein